MSIYNNKKTFFYKLKSSCKKEWSEYTNHKFLSNLVSNAIKFSTYGTIRLNVKKLKDFPNKEIIRFEVIDQGMGLDKETSDSIFLPVSYTHLTLPTIYSV